LQGDFSGLSSCWTSPPLRRQTSGYNMLTQYGGDGLFLPNFSFLRGNGGAAFKATMSCAQI